MYASPLVEWVLYYIINPWRACATRVTVVVLCVCVSMCVCQFSVFCLLVLLGIQREVSVAIVGNVVKLKSRFL